MITNNKKVKTVTITDVINVTQGIGDDMVNKYNAKQDLKVLSMGLDAYKTAIIASRTQLIYKKLTGNPGKIMFLEG